MSIRERKWKTKKGVTKVWVVDYTDQNGERCNQQFELRKDAVAYDATVKVNIRKGLHVSPTKSPTVDEGSERWLSRVEANGMNGEGPVDASTLRQYRQHVNLHIKPRIGNAKLGELSQLKIENFRDDLLENLSRALARKVFTSFKSILKANGCGHLADNVSIGREKRREKLQVGRDIPTPQEIKRLMDAVESDDHKRRALVSVASTAGPRSSELRGLPWRNVDLKAKQVKITQRADRDNEIGPCKSQSSVRTLPIDEMTVNALRVWKAKTAYSKPDDLVFCTRTGRPLSQDKMLDLLSSVMVAAKLTLPLEADAPEDAEPQHKYGLHSLRHFFASWCINAKESGGRELTPKKVQELMGHSSITITLDLYGHLFPDKSDRGELNNAVKALFG